MMKQYLIVSATGKDRTGFVHTITNVIRRHRGNIELQRSMRMADEYAMLALFSVEGGDAEIRAVIDALNGMTLEDAHVFARTAVMPATTGEGVANAHLEAAGADEPGRIDMVTRILFEHGVNIEEMNYDTESAPMTGDALFRMDARLAIGEGVEVKSLRDELRNLAEDHNFDVLLQHPM